MIGLSPTPQPQVSPAPSRRHFEVYDSVRGEHEGFDALQRFARFA